MNRYLDTATTNRPTEMPVRRAARIAGIGYLAIFTLAIFANFLVRGGLVEAGDAAGTVENIAASETLFRAGLFAFLIVFVVDVVIAWALYIVFRSINADLSLLTAWFRLAYTVFLGVALIFFFRVLELVDGESFLTAFDEGQRNAQVMLSLDAFNYAWLIGLACFGLHLFLLGGLILRTAGAPRMLGLVLMVAGAAYIVDTSANALLPSYEDLETIFLVLVAVPAVIAELAFAIWLLLRGGREPAPSLPGTVPTPVRAREA